MTCASFRSWRDEKQAMNCANCSGAKPPDDWRPFPEVGPGVNEIRIDCHDGWFRVMYVAKFEEAIYVLHSFQKNTRKTPRNDVEIAKFRYRAVGGGKEGIQMKVDTKSRHRTKAAGNVFLELGFPERGKAPACSRRRANR